MSVFGTKSKLFSLEIVYSLPLQKLQVSILIDLLIYEVFLEPQKVEYFIGCGSCLILPFILSPMVVPETLNFQQ